MKFLSFCSNFEEEIDVQGFLSIVILSSYAFILFFCFFIEIENITFLEYLKTTNLTENLIQYVTICIAMTEENASALEVN